MIEFIFWFIRYSTRFSWFHPITKLLKSCGGMSGDFGYFFSSLFHWWLQINWFCKSLRAAQDLPPDPRFGRGALYVSMWFSTSFSIFCCFCCMNWKRLNLCDALRSLRFLTRCAHSKPRLCGVIPHQRDALKPARYAWSTKMWTMMEIL